MPIKPPTEAPLTAPENPLTINIRCPKPAWCPICGQGLARWNLAFVHGVAVCMACSCPTMGYFHATIGFVFDPLLFFDRYSHAGLTFFSPAYENLHGLNGSAVLQYRREHAPTSP